MLNKIVFLLLIVSSTLLAQISYVAQKTTSLSSAAEVLTIQQPSTGSKLVEFKSAYVDCSVACVVTLERNGLLTTATSSSLATLNINPGEVASKATAWSSSNVGTGSVVSVVSLLAGSYIVFDLSGIYFPANNNPGTNFTIRISTITGLVHLTVKWTER